MIKIALFAYNRPIHLKSTINNLIKYSSLKINIYIDGANNEKDKKAQDEIDKVLEEVVSNTCNGRIHIKKRDQNLGLAKSITSGINDSFNECDELIVIEDDIATTKNFFLFMTFWLKKAKKDSDILSICGYQFPFNECIREDSLNSIKMPRFVPWGWATWKEKWNSYYNSDLQQIYLENNLPKYNHSLPEDIKTYINGESFDIESSDTWSIPWTLAHYLNNKKSIFPSYSLLQNIGFDGSGIHCGKTNIFDNIQKIKGGEPFELKNKIIRDLKMEIKTEEFMISKSYLTMTKAKDKDESRNNCFIISNQIKNINHLKKVIAKDLDFVDLHTHLFPACHKGYHKSGFVDLLNYHYLIPEIIKKIPLFDLKSSNLEKARLIWEHLFLKDIPLSTACKGIIKILDSLGISNKNISFEKLLEIEKNIKYDENDIFSKSNIRSVVMTNNPFDKKEWSLFSKNNWDRDLYKASLRLDYLLNLKDLKNISSFSDYIIDAVKLSSPKYLSFSLSNDNLKRLLVEEELMNFLESLNLPIWLMIGVKRKINPILGDAGDGVDLMDLNLIRGVASKWSSTKFLISNIHNRDEHFLNVLSRNCPNIFLAGTWWYMNNQSLASTAFRSRFEMIGSGHKLFFSDSRVLEQLIYKKIDFQDILDSLLSDLFFDFEKYNYQIDKENFINTINSMMDLSK